MPTGPKGEKRPADAIARAVKIMRIATGKEPEDYGDAPRQTKSASEAGRAGGKKRTEVVSPERRSEIAAKASKARWKKPSGAEQ